MWHVAPLSIMIWMILCIMSDDVDADLMALHVPSIILSMEEDGG